MIVSTILVEFSIMVLKASMMDITGFHFILGLAETQHKGRNFREKKEITDRKQRKEN